MFISDNKFHPTRYESPKVHKPTVSIESNLTGPMSIINPNGLRASSSSEEFDFTSEVNEDYGSFKPIQISNSESENQVVEVNIASELEKMLIQVKSFNKRLEFNLELLKLTDDQISIDEAKFMKRELEKNCEIGVEKSLCRCDPGCEVF